MLKQLVSNEYSNTYAYAAAWNVVKNSILLNLFGNIRDILQTQPTCWLMSAN